VAGGQLLRKKKHDDPSDLSKETETAAMKIAQKIWKQTPGKETVLPSRRGNRAGQKHDATSKLKTGKVPSTDREKNRGYGRKVPKS